MTDTRLDLAYAALDALRFIPACRRQAAALSAIRPLHALATGKPSDIAVENLLWKFGSPELNAVGLARSACGLLFVCPAPPLHGRLVNEVIQGLRALATKHGHTLYLTVNIETPTSAVAVGNLLFDLRNDEEVARVHRCAADLLTHIHSRALEVYRARADMADMMDALVARDPAHWSIVRDLKKSLDPGQPDRARALQHPVITSTREDCARS